MSNIYEYAKDIEKKVGDLIAARENYNDDKKEKVRFLIVGINDSITKSYSELEQKNNKIIIPEIPIPKKVASKEPTTKILSPQLSSEKFENLSEIMKKKYLLELNIDRDHLDRFVKEQKKAQALVLKKEEYSIYSPSDLGKFANRYAKHYSDLLISLYPRFFTFLFN